MKWLRGRHIHSIGEQAVLWGVFALAAGLIIWRPIGYRLSVIPGTYGDTRLINYILEHNYRWLAGLEPNYWNPGLFYPFPLALAFSDNLYGVGPFYAALRWAGLDRETALQAWIFLGFFLNYASAALVLRRLRCGAVASAAGASFFAFGLPMLAQVGHLQMLYRFCIPPACYLLWRFCETPRLRFLAGVALLTLWQAAAGVYLGVLLALLLAALAVVLPWYWAAGWRARLAFWPRQVQAAWQKARPTGRAAAAVMGLLTLAGLMGLFWPYLRVIQLYGFTRPWEEIARMLPQPQSYLVADHVGYWQPVSKLMMGLTMRHEHQLFPGLAWYALLAIGLAGRWAAPQRTAAAAHLLAAAALTVLTLSIAGVSLYQTVAWLPGMNSIRSVTRIILVLMWPGALWAAYAAGALLRLPQRPALRWLAAVLVLAAVLIEPLAFRHRYQFVKHHAQERLAGLRAQLPETLPPNPVLFVAAKADEDPVATEVDAMLLAQELGWPTLNGYSGNEPPGYHPATTCAELPRRIHSYMTFAGTTDERFYLNLMRRVVPLGFTDCDPAWWQTMPPFPEAQP